MPLQIVIGAQWGDEGKGRIVDLLSAQADVVARFNGGDNAGHTVTVKDRTFKLHLVPSGIIHPHTFGIMGCGMVVNPAVLLQEIDSLRAAGVQIAPQRLRISYAAHLVTPAHRALDRAMEAGRGHAQIGTTGRGIGPAYTDKTTRHGLRAQDMLNLDTFRQKLQAHVAEANRELQNLYQADILDSEAVLTEYELYARQLAPYICDTSALVLDALEHGKRVLAEGAQGVLLDIDNGTYPYVTSSTTTSAGALSGLGIGLQTADSVIGIVKAFQTRVGAGPFPTELAGEMAERLRGTGKNPWDEFGTTTGRPRRVGWLDGVLLRYACRTNTFSELTVTKLDILTGMPEIKICTAYRIAGKEYEYPPLGVADLADVEPVYETLPGWEEDVRTARGWNDLAPNARRFIQRIGEIGGVPVRRVSVGPEREQVV